MPRLPQPGGDDHQWGDILNEFLRVSLNSDGTLKASVTSNKEPVIAVGTPNQYWRGDKTWQSLNKAAVGLQNVDNTADANKPISAATQAALDAKANSADVIAFSVAF